MHARTGLHRLRWRSAAALLAAAVMLAGCTERNAESPTQPDFGKKPPGGCLSTDQQALSDAIGEDIGELFTDPKTKKAAKEHINNIERKLCKEQYGDSWNMAWDFLHFTDDKMPHKFLGDAADAAELTNKVFTLAADPSPDAPNPPDIPDGAFLPTGGVVSFDPALATAEDPIVASTENGEAAVVIDGPAVFPPGTGTVTIALSRASDADVTEPGGFIPGFQAFPEGYEILSSHRPSPTGGGVLIALCVVPFGAPANLVIGHLHEGNVELLVPTDPDPEYLGYIDCSIAAPTGDGVVEAAPVPRWRQLARHLLRPISRLVEPKPLNAGFFRGRGLGGRTINFSLDAPVDPTIAVGETVQLSVGWTDAIWTSDDPTVATVVAVDGHGLVTGISPGTATITADLGAVGSLSMVITVVSVCRISHSSQTHGQGNTAPNGVGQSFTACQDGAITSLRIDVMALDDPDASLEIQAGTSGWHATWSQTISLDIGENLIPLDIPFPVVDGGIYALGLFPSSGTLSLWSDLGTYPGGEAFFISGSYITWITPSPDLVFEVTIEGN